MIIVNVFDPKEYDIFVYGNRYSPGNVPLRSMKQWAEKAGADIAFNLAFFNFDTNVNRALNCAGRTLQYVHSPTIGDIGYDDAVGGRSPLIELDNGNRWRGYGVFVKNNMVTNASRSGRRARNMDGLTADGRYIHVTSDSQTEYYVAAYTINFVKKHYGTTVKLLLKEDSGGSTQEYSAISKLGYYPEGQRNIATIVGIKRKEPYVFKRVLRFGSRGEDVYMLQRLLGGIEVDGSFGYGTLKRVRQAQTALGLSSDGIAGPITLGKIGIYNP